MAKPVLTVERVREVFLYDPETGVLTNRIRRARTTRVGDVAGGVVGTGYVYVHVDGAKYPAHRLVWLFVTGSFPPGLVDHIDGNRTNNAWANLRLATVSENAVNSNLRKDNTSGHKGVTWDGDAKKWKARAVWGGREHSLGRHASFDDAVAAYRQFARTHHGAFYKPCEEVP